MYAITSRTDSEIVIEVVRNGKVVHDKLDHKFQVTTSERVTKGMIRLSNIDPKVISYVEIAKDDSNKSDGKKTRGKSNQDAETTENQ